MPKTQYIEPNEEIKKSSITRGDILSDFFEISDKAREGGMGDVFFCRDKRDNKFYVLKTYKDVADKDKSIIREDFRKEALIMFKMPRLPYVVFTRTLVVGEYKLYVLMDFIGKQPHGFDEPVQGENLAHVLKSTKVEYKQALIWGIEFCRGMQCLHKYGVPVHKDIKPENILLAPDNTIRIADFGLSALNKKGGTKGYLPPEYSEKQTLTEQSDIYSFGVVLYQLFNNVSVPRLSKNKVAENALLKKCLSINPSGRYPSFAHLETDLIKELKLQFPEYILPAVPKYSTTADEYFLKGLGVYLLSQYARTFDRSVKEDLNQEAEKLFSKCLALNSKHAAACYYHSKILEELNGLSHLLLLDKAIRVSWNSKKEKRKATQIRKEIRRAQENSAFYANLIELEYHRGQEDYAAQMHEPMPNELLLKNFAKHSTRYPKDPYLHNNLGVLEARTGHYQRAVEQFTKAIKLLPDYAVAYANRASVYLWLQQGSKALKDCAKYTQLQRDKKSFIPLSLFYGIYVQIFYWYCRQRKYDKAYAWYEKNLDLFPELKASERQNMLNRVRFQIQYHHLTRVVPPNYEKKHLEEYRGIWKLWKQIQQEKMPIEADDWFDKQEKQSLRLADWGFNRYPNMRIICYHRMCIEHPTAPILNEMGCYVANWNHSKSPEFLSEISYGKDAIPYFDGAIIADKTYAPAYYNRAHAYMECKEYANAIKDYTKALDLASKQACVYGARCGSYMQSAYEAADVNAGWKTRESGMITHPELGSINIKQTYSGHYIGNHLIIDSNYQTEYLSKPPLYKPKLSKARFYFEHGKYKRALSYFEQAEKLKSPVFYFKKGICFYKLGRYQKALKCFLEEPEIKRESSIHSEANIALCYAKLGNVKEAEKHLLESFRYFLSNGQMQDPKEKALINIAVQEKRIWHAVATYFENYYKRCLTNNQIFSIGFLQAPIFTDYIDNAYYQRAEAYFALKDYAHALKDYKRALYPDDIFPTVLIPKFELHIEQRMTACEEAIKQSSKKKK